MIATPGRVLDHLRNTKGVHLEELEVLVFDEADKLLELGFKNEIEEIIEFSSNNKDRQTVLFSATLSSDIKKLIKLALKKPLRIQANVDNKMSDNLRQEILKVDNMESKEAALIYLLEMTFK